MKNKKSSVFTIVVLIIVISLFIVINITYNKLNNIQISNKNNADNISYDATDIIVIKGIEETIKVAKYRSHLGFSLSYDVEKFRPSLLSNGTVEFIYYENKDAKLRVEKLNENDYYEKYQTNRDDEIIDDNKYSYKYMRKNNSYFLLVTIIPNNLEYTDIYTRIDYMTSSFDVN